MTASAEGATLGPSRIEATRRVQFAAGHRVYGHESKCRYVHGHNYVALFTVRCQTTVDELGRVMDFGELKRLLGGWIEVHWDHACIVWAQDREAIAALERVSEQRLFLLGRNPTAENMALHLLEVVAPEVLAGTGVTVEKVVLWETENCYAEVSVDAGEKSRPAPGAR